MNRTIAYQGEPGAFSHLACAERFPDLDPVPHRSFDEALQAVRDGRTELAMIPIENSLAGRVAEVHRLLPGAGLRIVGEHYLRVRLALLGTPGARIDDLVSVRSHVHALGQCRGFIRRHGLAPVIADDTAGAARELSETFDPSIGAISSTLAADIYGLDVLARDIEDAAHNTTRFVALTKADVTMQPSGAGTPGDGVITTVLFSVPNTPSALYKALGGFACHGVNLTRLESSMLGPQLASTQFMIDIEGSRRDPAVAGALEELHHFADHVDLLGTYPASARRPR